MATEAGTKITVEEFRELDLPRLAQLVDGEIVLTSPSPLHQRTCLRIAIVLQLWARAAPDRGEAWLPLDVEIDRHSLYVPDVLWTSADHSPDLEQGLERLPDLCVEVRSPSTWCYDVGVKKTKYERRGLPELWLVDTSAESVLVFRRSAPEAHEFDVSLELTGGDRLTSPQLAGFELSLTELFASS